MGYTVLSAEVLLAWLRPGEQGRKEQGLLPTNGKPVLAGRRKCVNHRHPRLSPKVARLPGSPLLRSHWPRVAFSPH